MLALKDLLPNIVHVGALLYLVCFLFRDQIMLRSFAIAGDFAYTSFYYTAASEPLWSAMFWSVLNIAINLLMIAIILRDKRTSSFSDDELRLFHSLSGLTPSDFRKIVKLGKWNRSTAETVLSVEGQPLDKLHYVLEGGVDIEKGGRSFSLEPGMFIGEVAFLKKWPASATVKVKPGSLYFSWPHAELTRAQIKHDSLKNAISGMLNSDMAEKVARS